MHFGIVDSHCHLFSSAVIESVKSLRNELAVLELEFDEAENLAYKGWAECLMNIQHICHRTASAGKEEQIIKMAGEGEVIACHTLEVWNEKVKDANESKKLIVIDFTASWCPPCRFIAPVFAEMAKKFTNVVFFKIDVDELQAVAQEFKVEAMPTFVFMKEGNIIDRVVGAAKDEINEKLMKHGGLVASA